MRQHLRPDRTDGHRPAPQQGADDHLLRLLFVGIPEHLHLVGAGRGDLFELVRRRRGFLRWAYNSWVEDPIRDSRFRKWAAGDTYLVYPEGRSSIRFERLVEGIQDWEKIRLLKTEFSGDDAKLQTLHDLLEPFRSSVAFDGWEQTLRNARATLNTL